MRRKKWKQQARILQYLFYVGGARIGVCFFQVMSNSAARALADLVGWIVFTFDHKHRRMALENLRRAFPGRYSEKQLHAMVLATYRHFFTLFGEIIQMPRKVHRHNADYHLDLGPRKEEVLKLLHSDRPLLIVTGHFGNWELAGVWLGALGFRTYAVARPLDNVYLNAYFQSIREHLGQTILPSVAICPLFSERSPRAARSRCSPINTPARAGRWSISSVARLRLIAAFPSSRCNTTRRCSSSASVRSLSRCAIRRSSPTSSIRKNTPARRRKTCGKSRYCAATAPVWKRHSLGSRAILLDSQSLETSSPTEIRYGPRRVTLLD